MSTAPSELVTAGLATASEELHKAIEALSRRPTPDLTGAVQHGMPLSSVRADRYVD